MSNLYVAPINRLEFPNICAISKKCFDDINNLYKFYPIREQNITYYYNKKRNCYAVRKTVDKLLHTDVYYLDKSWFKEELFATNSETLQKVGNVTPELYFIVNNYLEKKEKEQHRHGSLLDAVTGGLDELLELVKT